MRFRSLPSLAFILCLLVAPAAVAQGAIYYQDEDEFGRQLELDNWAICEDGGDSSGGGLVDDGSAVLTYTGVNVVSFDDMSVEMQQWGLASAFYVIAADAVLRGDDATAVAAAQLGQTYTDSLIADGMTGDGVLGMAAAFHTYLADGVLSIGTSGFVDHNSVEWDIGDGLRSSLTVEQATEILRGRAMVDPG